MMATGIKKKITKLLNYIRPLSPTAVGKMQERMLMNLTNQLQSSIDHMHLMWLEKRDEVPQPQFERFNTFLHGVLATGEAALQKAEQFLVLSNRPRSPARPSTKPPADKLDCLDNILKSDGNLKRTMTLEEARIWLRKFDQWFKWNANILHIKGLVAQRVLLENFLDDRMLSKIQSDGKN